MATNVSMFKEEQKSEYIRYEKENSIALERLFKKLYKYEEVCNKDIADMDSNELIDTITALNMHREDYRAQVISLLRGYIRWARRYGKTDNDSAIFVITAESINSKAAIQANMIKSPKHLESIVDIATPKDKKSDKNVPEKPKKSIRDNLIFWLLYSGISLDDIAMLKKKDIDIDNKTVIINNGSIYAIDDRIIPLWMDCVSLDCIEKRNGKATAKGRADSNDIIYQNLLDSEYLFRPLKGNSDKPKNKYMSVNTHRKIIKSMCEAYYSITKHNIKISPDNIRLSGMFYKLYMLEQQDHKITSVELEEYLKSIKPSSDSNVPFNVRKWRIAYEDWKLAFNYM